MSIVTYSEDDLNGYAGLDDMSIATDTIHYCYNCLLPYSPSDSDSFYETTFCGSECEVEYGPIVEEDPAS